MSSFWDWITKDSISFFTAVLAVLTGALVFFGGWQAWLTRRTIDLAREEFIASHYPRIVLREVDLIEGRVHYMLVNEGSEATLVESWVMVEAVAVGAPQRNLRPFQHDDLGPLKFAHGERKALEVETTGAGFHMRYPDAERSGIEGIYFVGALTYRDGLGNRRCSFFRRRWNPVTDSFERTGNPDHEYAD